VAAACLVVARLASCVVASSGPLPFADFGALLNWLRAARAVLGDDLDLHHLEHWRLCALVIVQIVWPNLALKRTPRTRGFATVPGSRLACIR
jgi:hypothetical protein